ncbi:hypothetical protein Tco_0102724 [Tanacetum coccineum]
MNNQVTPPDTSSVQAPIRVCRQIWKSRAKVYGYFSNLDFLCDSSRISVGTPIGREILFGTIPTTIPDTTPVVTPLTTQTDTPSLYPSKDPIIQKPYTTLPSLPHHTYSSDDDPTDSDTPIHHIITYPYTPFTEITASTQRSPTKTSSSELCF